MAKSNTMDIKIRQRPWWAWLLAALWLILEIFFLQSAIASSAEHEPQAALIFWVLLVVFAIAGVLGWRSPGRKK